MDRFVDSLSNIPLHVEKPSVAIRTAQVVGLTSAAYLFGHTASASAACAVFMEAPAPLLAKQWKKLYDNGIFLKTALSVISTGTVGYLAYREPAQSANRSLWITSAVLLPSLIPYTLFALKPLNDKLQDKASSLAGTSLEDSAAESGVAKEETVHSLVDRWATLNLGGAALTLAGTLTALWAAVDKYDVIGLADISFKTGANRIS